MKSSGGERDENGCWDDENGTKKTVPFKTAVGTMKVERKRPSLRSKNGTKKTVPPFHTYH